jgi:hypothetical protein
MVNSHWRDSWIEWLQKLKSLEAWLAEDGAHWSVAIARQPAETRWVTKSPPLLRKIQPNEILAGALDSPGTGARVLLNGNPARTPYAAA